MTSIGHVPASERRSNVLRLRAAILIGLALPCFPGRPSVATDGLDKEVTLHIAPQRLSNALLEFSRAADVIIMSDSFFTGSSTSEGVTGRLRADTALTTLLHGTGLIFSTSGPIVFVTPAERPAQQSTSWQTKTASDERTPKRDSRHDRGDSARTNDLEEVLVTGSHIRGAESASPSMQFTHEDIERAGSLTLSDFLLTLPQNFGGGVHENSATGEAAPGGSYTVGSGVNLRGLGNGATLPLVNGHRMISAGLGDYVDVASAIPMAAIDRIDILTDGASAIYGSDAVAGVMNFTLRDRYDGAKSDMLYGYPTQGGGRELRVSQLFGRVLDSARFVAAYEYYRRQPLDSRDRNFTANAPAPLYLLPDVRRSSLFLHGVKEFGDNTELSADVLGSRRDYTSRSNTGGGAFPLASIGSVNQLAGTLGLKTDLSTHWRLNAFFNYMSSTSPSKNFLLPVSVQIVDIHVRSASRSVDAYVEGPLFAVRAGDIRLALGTQIRRDTYDYNAGGQFEAKNHVTALFGELAIPLVNSDASIRGVDDLHCSIAGRYEHHSYFGGTTNPQLGLVWRPIHTLEIRGTYGRSFRTPTLDQTSQEPNQAAFLALPDPSSVSGTTPTLVLTGNAPNLRPERATTWTGGLSWNASRWDLKVAATYFDVNYRDRLATPGDNLLSGLIDSSSLGPLIVRNPSVTQLEQLSSQAAQQSNEENYALTDVRASLDYRLRNLAEERLRGVDLALAKTWQTGVGSIKSQLNMQYLFAHTRQATPDGPVTNLSNFIFEPTKFRVRDISSWQVGRLTADIALNYTNGYFDNRSGPRLSIGAWTTLDAGISYEIGSQSAVQWAQNLTVRVSVINAFDRLPPFVRDRNQVNFDGANASPIGRLVGTWITKSW